MQDVRYAVGMIRRSPGFSAAVVLTLMLGIGANSAIFSVLNGVVLSPMPYPDADRLLHVWTQYPLQDIDRFEVSEAEFIDYKVESGLFDSMFAYNPTSVVLTGAGSPLRVPAVLTSAEIWDVLGVIPAAGSTFGWEHDQPNTESVVVLDHGFWMQQFGGDPAAVGRIITLDGLPSRIIGVAEEDFALPAADADLYIPLAIDAANLTVRHGHGLRVIGRMRDGIDMPAVLAEMNVVSDRWAKLYEHAHPLTAIPVREDVIGDARSPLLVLAGAVGMVLLIACANVAGLLMARTTGRQREIAVRAALGAQRLRLMRQVLTEGVLLALLGGALGLLVADWGTQLLLALEPGNLPRLDEINSDATVMAFALALSVITGLGFAALPAWRAARVGGDLALTTNRSTAGVGRQRFQRIMVVAEVAIAVVLVVGAGLLVRSFSALTDIDPGVETDSLMASRVTLPFSVYGDAGETQLFWETLDDRLAAVPGFRSTALVRALPLRDETFMERFLRSGETVESVAAEGHSPSFDYQLSFPGYFRTAGIPLTAGRDFTDADRAGTPRVAIVTESLVRRYFPDRNPVGERIHILASNPNDVPFEIIGVAGDTRHAGLGSEPPIQIFVPYAQAAEYRAGLTRTAAILVRTDLDPESAATSIRETIWSLDPDLAVADVTTLDDLMHRSVARPRFTTLMLSLFSALALLLACIGVYSIVAYSVAQRTREMGVRMALGAQPRAIISLGLREGIMPAAAGIVVGVLGALFLTRFLADLLFGVTATDPVTYVLVTVALGSAATLAAWIPARRATEVDPLESLRTE